MNATLTVLALLTGLCTGALFAYLGVPIPAPPELPGVAGILGIYLGFRLIERLGVGIDVLAAIGL